MLGGAKGGGAPTGSRTAITDTGVNDRIQVFRKDGTSVKEFQVEAQTLANGSVWDLVLSEDPAQDFIFIADGANNQIVTLKRETGEVLTAWGRAGRMAGQFKWVHNIGIDAKGNLYTAEVGFGRRAQKFKRLNGAASGGRKAGSRIAPDQAWGEMRRVGSKALAARWPSVLSCRS